MLGNYSLDWMLVSLVRALGPRVSMARVKAGTQALSPWLLTDSTTLAKTPYVFGAVPADLLRRLAKAKHLQPGGSDLNCLDCSSSEDCSYWSNPSELEDPEVELRRLLSDSEGSEKADSSLRGILDPFDGKDNPWRSVSPDFEGTACIRYIFIFWLCGLCMIM